MKSSEMERHNVEDALVQVIRVFAARGRTLREAREKHQQEFPLPVVEKTFDLEPSPFCAPAGPAEDQLDNGEYGSEAAREQDA